jgi:hypothetical protein
MALDAIIVLLTLNILSIPFKQARHNKQVDKFKRNQQSQDNKE